MKRMKFIWHIDVIVDEDDVRDFLDLDEEDEVELTDSDFYDCAWNRVEEEDCEYDYYGSESLS